MHMYMRVCMCMHMCMHVIYIQCAWYGWYAQYLQDA